MRKGASKPKSATPTSQHAAVKSSCQCDACAKKKGVLQRAAVSEHAPEQVPDIVYDVLNSSGQPLDRATREFMEDRFNHDFSAVRVHTDARAAESARAVNARAYTVGSHVAFSRNAYAPATSIGWSLLAHELTHVVQQKGAHSQPESLSIQQAPIAEGEADRNMSAVLRGDTLQSSLRLLGRTLQRFPLNRPAEPDDGKCYVGTGVTPMEVGKLAHKAIQTQLLQSGIDNEVTLKLKSKGRTSRADLIGLWREDEARARGLPVGSKVQTPYGQLPYVVAEIGEIKPYSYSIGGDNHNLAKREIEDYLREWKETYPDIPAVPMRSAPPGVVSCVFGATTKQVLWRPSFDGLVIYNCPLDPERKLQPAPSFALAPAKKSDQQVNRGVLPTLSHAVMSATADFILTNLNFHGRATKAKQAAKFVSESIPQDLDRIAIAGLTAAGLLLLLAISPTASALILAALIISAAVGQGRSNNLPPST
jgi:hypothetical protein